MGEIRKEVVLRDPNTDKSESYQALFDNGATHSYVSERVADYFSESCFRYTNPVTVKSAFEGMDSEITSEVTLQFELDGCRPEAREIFRVVPGLREDIIIGAITMEGFDIQLHMKPPDQPSDATFKHFPPEVWAIR